MFLKKIITKFQKKRYERFLEITEYYNNLSDNELTCEYINLKASYKFKKISFALFTPLFLFVLYKIIGVLYLYSHFFPTITFDEITPDMIKVAIFSSINIIIATTFIIYIIVKVILNILRYNYQILLIIDLIINKRKKAS
jgi:hypothetical protein